MTTPQEHYSAKELAGMPGMPGTERSVQRTAQRKYWPSRKRSGSKALEYSITDLPKETQSALLDAAIAALPETSCPLPALKPNNALVIAEDLPAPAKLAAWQRNTMDARLQILALLDTLTQQTSLNKAIVRIIAHAENELLPQHIQALIPLANARSGKGDGKRTLSRRTLFRWRELRTIGTTALAPVESKKAEIPAWAPYFLKCWQKLTGVSVPDALAELKLILPEQIAMPSLPQVRRFIGKMSKVEREKGRRSPKEMRAILPYRRRDTSDLVPLEVTSCDGHSFKARIAHPVHGKPFHPEVCAVIDAATRVVIGWSAGLAESAQTVADALRHGIAVSPGNERGGIPAIFYTDPGSGNKAKVNADPAFGRYARLGITFKTGIVGNSQARGMVERLQQTLWIKAAQQLPTFTGKAMDKSAEHKTYKLLMSDVRGTTKSGILPSWPQFLDLCQQAVDRYNNTPHSTLPKIVDAGGHKRNMTPCEKWDRHLANGWLPDTVNQHELDDLFRPRVQVKTNRGEVRLFSNVYFNSELKHHNDEQVFVEYEPQNGQYVYVRDMEERLICKAEFEGNKTRMFSVSATEDAMDKRAAARTKRLDIKRDEIEQERRGVVDLVRNGQAVHLDSTEEKSACITAAFKRIDEAKKLDPETPKSKPVETPASRHARWQRIDERYQCGNELNEADALFHGVYPDSADYRTYKMMAEDFGDFYQTETIEMMEAQHD